MFCNQCGSQNGEGSKFCYNCGAPLVRQSSGQSYGGNNTGSPDINQGYGGNYSGEYSANQGYGGNSTGGYSANSVGTNSQSGYNAGGISGYGANNNAANNGNYGGAPRVETLSYKEFYKKYTAKRKRILVVAEYIWAYINAAISLIYAIMLFSVNDMGRFGMAVAVRFYSFIGVFAIGIFICGLFIHLQKNWKVSVVLSIIYCIIWGLSIGTAVENVMSGFGPVLVAVWATIILYKAEKAYKIYRNTGVLPEGYNTFIRDLPNDTDVLH